jgi:3-hydroxybutyryl-CoA dehydratase
MPEATPEFQQRLREAFEALHLGQAFTFRRTFTNGDVALFCGVTGDYNPYHQDEAFARESWYGRLTIPGLLTGSMLTHIGASWAFLPQRCPSNTWPQCLWGYSNLHRHYC